MRIFGITSLFFFASFFVINANRADEYSILRGENTEGSFVAKANKDTYVFGEPTYFEFIAKLPADYPTPHFFSDVLISVESVRGLSEFGVLEPTKEVPLFLPNGSPRTNLPDVRNNDLKTFRQSIHFRRFYEIFSEPGTYKLRFTLKIKDKPNIHSNWVEFSLTTPEGEDRKAYERLIELNGGSNFAWTWTSDIGLKKLESFVSDFPATAYSESAIFELAGIYYAKGELGKARTQYELLASSKTPYIYSNVVEKLERIKIRISERQ